MRVPVSWLRELVAYPEDVSPRQLADKLVNLGLEVETVDEVGAEIVGPLVLGRVLAFSEEEHSNGKTIRWCRVDVGAEHNEPAGDDLPAGRGIVCGARNFKVDDLVVVALPGAILPGGFNIGARKTYGHVSDGMICSTRECRHRLVPRGVLRRRRDRGRRGRAPVRAGPPESIDALQVVGRVGVGPLRARSARLPWHATPPPTAAPAPTSPAPEREEERPAGRSSHDSVWTTPRCRRSCGCRALVLSRVGSSSSLVQHVVNRPFSSPLPPMP